VRIRIISSTVAIAALIALVSATPALAQGRGGRGGPPAPTGPAPKTVDGKPDFSGLWQRPYTPDMSLGAVNMDGKPYALENPPAEGAQGRGGRGGGPRKLPYTAWGAEEWKNYDAAKLEYTGSCLPFGLTRSMNSPDPIQIMQSPQYLALLYEQNTWFKVFPLDGRPHKKDATPTWFGESVGRWEGDTLVVDTVNFNGKTKLDTNGHPMSDQLHTIERFHRRDLGHIDYVLTIDDPKTYTKRWDSVRTWTLRPEWEIMEYSCEENNKDILEGHIKAGVQP